MVYIVGFDKKDQNDGENGNPDNNEAFEKFEKKPEKEPSTSDDKVKISLKEDDGSYKRTLKEETNKAFECNGDSYEGIGIGHDGLFNMVTEVPEGYPAHRAGVMVGDTIVGFYDHLEINKFVRSTNVRGASGTKLDLVVERDGKEIRMTITREKICYTVKKEP
jgi:C-terminal processing protease CtpA/Prc